MPSTEGSAERVFVLGVEKDAGFVHLKLGIVKEFGLRGFARDGGADRGEFDGRCRTILGKHDISCRLKASEDVIGSRSVRVLEEVLRPSFDSELTGFLSFDFLRIVGSWSRSLSRLPEDPHVRRELSTDPETRFGGLIVSYCVVEGIVGVWRRVGDDIPSEIHLVSFTQRTSSFRSEHRGMNIVKSLGAMRSVVRIRKPFGLGERVELFGGGVVDREVVDLLGR